MSIKRLISRPAVTLAAFVLAAGLLLFSTIGGTRAALTYFSETYTSSYGMYDIGVTLLENGEPVSWRNYSSEGSWSEETGMLLGNLLPDGESVKIGKRYAEELSVANTGSINQYVRVSIHKYWTDAEGKKLQSVSPDLIGLNLVNTSGGWILDESSSTKERTVLYYGSVLNVGQKTEPFTDSLIIDRMTATKVTQTETKENGYTTITTAYDYDGLRFWIEAKVDAVQEHNAEDAIWSAWGREVTVSGGNLSLN